MENVQHLEIPLGFTGEQTAKVRGRSIPTAAANSPDMTKTRRTLYSQATPTPVPVLGLQLCFHQAEKTWQPPRPRKPVGTATTLIHPFNPEYLKLQYQKSHLLLAILLLELIVQML